MRKSRRDEVRFSLVILTSRFEATRGLFWDGPRNDEDGAPSPRFHATPTGGHLSTTYDLMHNRPHTRRIFSGIGFRTWNRSRDLTARPRRP
ncbi:hypothetical protein AVEN_137125-1 [Araneus ventricosus]|uniref:Uncharacterized protein n=1 Tax=Araneus ventricosus TaxID=182803 RepID=A0A4Y2LHF9_ARAVE|nr:hypothetical protein AVEN_137125-1 [Araneus ventricosus]